MNRYQERILRYYKEVVIPAPNSIEILIVLVSGIFFVVSVILQVDDRLIASIFSMIIGFVGLNHVLNNDNRRKVHKIKLDYLAYCRARNARPSLLGLGDSMRDARKIWFCMSHNVDSERLFETARIMREDYSAFKELESARNISFIKTGRLLVWFDNSRLVSLLSIVVALLSVLALVGVEDTDLIVEAFFLDVFPALASFALYFIFGYLILFFMTPIIPAIFGLWAILLVRLFGETTDRSVKRYIYDMMQASD